MKFSISIMVVLFVIAATTILLVVFHPFTAKRGSPAKPLGYYWSIQPPGGVGPPAAIGPYPDLSSCRDMLGSAENAHGFGCHQGWTPMGCTIVKDANGDSILGFGYPTGYGPVPPNPVLVSADCYQAPSRPALADWVFAHFTPDGGVKVDKCSDLGKVIALHRLNPKHRIGYYFNRNCPGAPCFTPKRSTACN